MFLIKPPIFQEANCSHPWDKSSISVSGHAGVTWHPFRITKTLHFEQASHFKSICWRPTHPNASCRALQFILLPFFRDLTSVFSYIVPLDWLWYLHLCQFLVLLNNFAWAKVAKQSTDIVLGRHVSRKACRCSLTVSLLMNEHIRALSDACVDFSVSFELKKNALSWAFSVPSLSYIFSVDEPTGAWIGREQRKNETDRKLSSLLWACNLSVSDLTPDQVFYSSEFGIILMFRCFSFPSTDNFHYLWEFYFIKSSETLNYQMLSGCS